MATFGELQIAVSKRLQDASNQAVALSDVASSINDSIRYWKFRRFWFNDKNTTLTMTARLSTVPLPSDFLVNSIQDDGLNIQYSGSTYPLTKVSIEQFDSRFLDNGYGMPCVYTNIGGNIYKCYPIPDRAYTVGIHYLKEYTDLANSSDTNDFTIYAPRLITLWASANCSGDFRQDEKMEGYFRMAAMAEYNNLNLMNGKSNSTGKLKLTSII